MATLANLPFCLEMRKKNIEDNEVEVIVLRDFYDSVFELKKQPKPELRILENRSLDARLTSTKMDAKLDMDGFDGVDVPEIMHADGKYLCANYDFTRLFNGEKFPLPPGMYILKVTVEKQAYYAGFEVVSAVLENFDIWKGMLSDIINMIPKQTVDYAYIRSAAKQFSYNEVTPHMLWKMMVLNESYTRVVAALNDIKCNPHNRLVKSYVLTNKNNTRKQDLHAQRLNITKRRPDYKVYSPKKEVSNYLLENRYLKGILNSLEKNIQLCLNEASKDMEAVSFDLKNVKYQSDTEKPEYIRKLNVNQFLQAQCQKIIKLQMAIRELKRVDWIKELPDFVGPVTSTQNFSDPRYNVVFSLYSKLDKISRDYSNEKHMTLLWKRTGLLYEYWNIISLVKMILKNGFELVNNPKVYLDATGLHFKSISSGDYYCFKSQDSKYMIKLYYEKAVPSVSQIKFALNIDFKDAEEQAKRNTDKMEQPLYTPKSKNTPDCIIDFYQLDKQGLQYSYLGALICDFKYRKREALWKDAFEYTFRPGQEDDCKGQFMAYKNMKTIYFGTCTGEFGNTSDKFINPVHEVWALYPNMKEPKSIEFKAGYGIRLISSMPGNEDVLDKCMKSFINWLLPDYQT